MLLASTLGRGPGTLRLGDRLLGDLRLDELSLVRVLQAVLDLNPYFALPDQMDVEDVTVGDLHHFCCVMGPGHIEPVTPEGRRLNAGLTS